MGWEFDLSSLPKDAIVTSIAVEIDTQKTTVTYHFPNQWRCPHCGIGFIPATKEAHSTAYI